MKTELAGRYIVSDPKICHGQPTFRGTRILVADVLERLSLPFRLFPSSSIFALHFRHFRFCPASSHFCFPLSQFLLFPSPPPATAPLPSGHARVPFTIHDPIPTPFGQ